MAPKTVFLAFAEEDKLFRDLFITQWARAGAPLEFLAVPGGRTCSQPWKEQAWDRIRRSDGVIALIGGNTPASVGELWQIRCAVAEGKPLLGLWVDSDHRIKPAEMGSARCETWTWENVGDFIDRL